MSSSSPSAAMSSDGLKRLTDDDEFKERIQRNYKILENADKNLDDLDENALICGADIIKRCEEELRLWKSRSKIHQEVRFWIC